MSLHFERSNMLVVRRMPAKSTRFPGSDIHFWQQA
jgi:hypothetical protein